LQFLIVFVSLIAIPNTLVVIRPVKFGVLSRPLSLEDQDHVRTRQAPFLSRSFTLRGPIMRIGCYLLQFFPPLRRPLLFFHLPSSNPGSCPLERACLLFVERPPAVIWMGHLPSSSLSPPTTWCVVFSSAAIEMLRFLRRLIAPLRSSPPLF